MPLEHIWGWPPEPHQGHNTSKLPLRMGQSLEGMTSISLLSCHDHVSWIFSLCLRHNNFTSAKEKCWSLSRVQLFVTPWSLARFLCPWDSPGKHTGVQNRPLLQGMFLILGSNPGFLHCRQIPYCLSTRKALISAIKKSSASRYFCRQAPWKSYSF